MKRGRLLLPGLMDFDVMPLPNGIAQSSELEFDFYLQTDSEDP